jgi:hypothetical protein
MGTDLKIRELNVDMIAPSFRKYRDPDQGGSKIVVIGKPGCFGAGTMVQVMSMSENCEGYKDNNIQRKRIEDVEIGDCLVGEDGKPRRVWEICRGMSLFFSIFSCADNQLLARVNIEHILTVLDVNHGRLIDVPLMDFLRDAQFSRKSRWDSKKYRVRHGFKWVKIPITENLSSVPSAPYMLERFYIVNENVIDQYYGVVLRDNHRFLLANGSLVHNTGKTTLITSLLYEKSLIFPTGLVMSGTEDSNGHYKKIFPSTFVYNRLDEKKIEDFVTRQKIAKRHVSNPWSVLLLDDCTDEPRILNKPIFQGLYKNGRHWKMLFILSLQYCMDIRPVIRTNIDGTFILRESNLRNRKTLWENYAGIIPDFGLFCQIMDVITDDYTALYIHNATQSNNLEDCVFWYKAKKVPSNFRFGARDFWRFHKQRYDPSYRDGFKIY